MELQELRKIAFNMESTMKQFLDNYDRFSDETDLNSLSLNEQSDLMEMHNLSNYVGYAIEVIRRVKKEVTHEGELEKKSNGRYEVQGFELTSGMPIEFLKDDIFYPSRIEHNGYDYYIYDLGRNEPIQGVYARLRV